MIKANYLAKVYVGLSETVDINTEYTTHTPNLTMSTVGALPSAEHLLFYDLV